jgi:hypothetical protein
MSDSVRQVSPCSEVRAYMREKNGFLALARRFERRSAARENTA